MSDALKIAAAVLPSLILLSWGIAELIMMFADAIAKSPTPWRFVISLTLAVWAFIGGVYLVFRATHR